MIRIENPYRQRRVATFDVDASPDDVFALMCPVREYDWIDGWRTELILSASGLVEEGCIFTTPPKTKTTGASKASTTKSPDAIWVTPIHDPKARRLMMIKTTPGECVTRLDIEIKERPEGCAATIAYEHTALSEAGHRIVDQHTEESYEKTMASWKAAIELHLSKG